MTGTETRVRPHQPRDSRWGARRVNLAIAATAWMLALAALVLHLVLAPLLPPRIHIRWSDVTTSTERIRVEEELGLLSGAHEQGRTWSYVLRDVSTTSIARLVRHPLVEDTHYIDRSTATLSVDASGRAAWVGDVAQMPFVQVSLRWLPTIAFALAIVGLVGSWPVWHGVVPRAWRQVQDGLRWARGAVRARVGRIRSERRSRDQRVRRMALGRGAAFQLSLILLVSILLRIWLVTSGGQFYWGDESRYEIARDIARTLAHGDVLYAFSRMGQHPLFGVIGAIPATVERLTHEDPRIPGLFFAAFSAMNIGLIAAVAKRSGATDGTSVTAGALIGLSASMLYYARHLLPYDVAMTFGLAALYIGLGDAGRVRSLACGVVAAFAFLTYTGYWTLGGAAMVVHVLDAGNAKTALRRALFGGLGLVATIGVAVVGSLVVGENLIRALAEFSGQVDQGDFREGWRLPWEYLWHAEHFIVLVWVVAVTWVLVSWRSRSVPRLVRVGLIGLAFVYGALVVTSVVTHTFVVYGRLARQMVPFLCLISAAALADFLRARSPSTRVLLGAAVALPLIVQAAFNFATPLRQVFPAEFLREARRDGQIGADADLVILNAKRLYPGPETIALPPRYTVLMHEPHPLQYLPFQYEGFRPAQREALRSADIEMKVLLVPR